jgi:hypothetical protein
VLVLVLFLMLHVYRTRGKTEPPKRMSKLRTAEPRFALVLGVALLGVMPPDIVGSITVGPHLARHDDPWWQCLPFVG